MPKTETQTTYFSKRIGRNVFEASPKISVVIPAYNSAEHIAEAIDSVLKQKFREHEIIVVNDGSPDSVQFERAIKMQLEDIIYIKQRNAGAGMARNLAIEHARGDIVAFLDADDVWHRDFLASQYVFLERNGYDMVYCDAELFGMRSPYRRTFMETAPSKGEANFDSILDIQCNVITSGTMARKETLLNAGLFEKEQVASEDFHLWLRVAKSGAKIGYQEKPLLKYRVHVNGLSGSSVDRANRMISVFKRVLETIEMTDEQSRRVHQRIEGLEADLAVEKGKVFLLNGAYTDAANAFKEANNHRKSLKLAAISLMSRIAPSSLVRLYKSHRSAEIAFVPPQF